MNDYVQQSLSHMDNASQHHSSGLTVLEHTDVQKELREEIRQISISIYNLQENLIVLK